MKCVINGNKTETKAVNLQELIEEKSEFTSQKVAIAVNGEIVHKHSWHAKILKEDDQIDVFSAFSGG